MNRLGVCHGSIGLIAVLIAAATPPSPASAQRVSFRAAPASPIAAGSSPSSVAAGDFNGDGHADFAVTSSKDNTVLVYLGNGDGTFAPASGSPVTVNRNPFPTPCLLTKCSSIPIAVAVGDFNLDGRLDLAVTNIPLNDLCSIGSIFGGICSSVAVLLGNGDGSFQPSNQFDPGGQLPLAVAIADFNNDGKADVAVTNFNSSTVSILLGDGTGKAFRHAVRSPMSVGRRPAWVSVGDLDKDGTTDLAVANGDDGTVRILRGNGDGSFTAAQGSPRSVGIRPVATGIADFDNDGLPDLAVADFSESTVWVMLGRGAGTFAPPTAFGVGAHPSALALADYDHDGNVDIVVANRLGNSISILQGNGRGSFVRAGSQAVGLDPQSAAIGDFNGDDETDLLLALASDDKVIVLLNAIDRLPPATVAAASPDANAGGWRKSSVTVSLTATDNAGGSGVKQLRYKVGSNPEIVVAGGAATFNVATQGVLPVSYLAVDNSGNVETTHTLTVRIDTTLPTMSASQSPAPNGARWNNSNVTVTFSCADAVSGIASCASPVTVSTEGANQTATGTAYDVAGNTTSTTRTVSLDKTSPALTLPALAASYAVNNPLTLNFFASDALSGLANVAATLNGAPVSSGSTVTLTHAGPNSFALTAVDVAGNTATEVSTFNVLFNFGGFLPPVANNAVFKRGSTIPVKFRLTDGNGAHVAGVSAHLSLQLLSSGTPAGSPIDAAASGSSDAGHLFRDDGTQYVYNLATSALPIGTWQLQVSLADGTVQTVVIGLK